MLYSGTVAAAIEGAFFGVTSVAVSLEYNLDGNFDAAAVIACKAIRDLLKRDDTAGGLFNINVPTAATHSDHELKTVPMGLTKYGRSYEKRTDPGGRNYYWALWSDPTEPPPEDTDLSELLRGNVTLTPLCFDMANHELLKKMK